MTAAITPLAASAASTSTVPPALAAKAKISLAQARRLALATVRGTIAGEELEREAGGLRYTFDITTPRGQHEVGVDAITARIIENVVEKPATEKVERK
ncbi:PepSY domain-containing protein [Vulcanimicrobium alpinum]|uniref:PepSY domain-containing protein n=1 Tax=Vulcanimicrobium alpinum TaxID=3016050 RepID=UPI00295E993E|nr:PepSY domain-containing protein [Vulcanimicrobium alpinum]